MAGRGLAQKRMHLIEASVEIRRSLQTLKEMQWL
jgi:hypothetical protein